jgi:Tfp pilus assembly pilus retraction ATPase PilT
LSITNKTAFVQETKPSPTLAGLLGVLIENKGSDLHVQSGEVPIGRINGELGRFEMPALTESDVLRLAREALGSDEKMQQFQAGQAILNARHREEEQARSRHSRQSVRF